MPQRNFACSSVRTSVSRQGSARPGRLLLTACSPETTMGTRARLTPGAPEASSTSRPKLNVKRTDWPSSSPHRTQKLCSRGSLEAQESQTSIALLRRAKAAPQLTSRRTVHTPRTPTRQRLEADNRRRAPARATSCLPAQCGPPAQPASRSSSRAPRTSCGRRARHTAPRLRVLRRSPAVAQLGLPVVAQLERPAQLGPLAQLERQTQQRGDETPRAPGWDSEGWRSATVTACG